MSKTDSPQSDSPQSGSAPQEPLEGLGLVPMLSFDTGEGLLTIDLAEMFRANTFIQGATRAGKSWLLRFLMEALFGRVQQVVFDTEGEFASLTEKFDYALFSQDTPVQAAPANAPLLVRRLLEMGTSAIFDLADLSTLEQQEFVRRATTELIAATTKTPHRVLIVLDEIQRLAPNSGQGEATSTQALRELANRGLKRGLFLLAASQRHSSVDPAVRGGMTNLLVGGTPPGLDMETAGGKLGFNAKERRQLAALPRGEFFALGAMFDAEGTPREVHRVRSGAVRTRHLDAMEAKQYTPPAASEAVQRLLEQLGDLPAQAEREAESLEEALERLVESQERLGEARAQIAALERQFKERLVADVVIERVEVPILTAEDAARLSESVQPLHDLLGAFLGRLGAATASIMPPAVAVREIARQKPNTADAAAIDEFRRTSPLVPALRVAEGEGGPNSQAGSQARLSRSQQAILDTLATIAALGLDRPQRSHVALFSGVSPLSSGFEKNLSTLRTSGLLDYPERGLLSLTNAGRGCARPSARPFTLDDLHAAWVRQLSGPQGAILVQAAAEYPSPLSRMIMARRVGVSENSSGFEKNLSRLRSLGLLEYPERGYVAATSLLFPVGLT